MEDWIIVLKLIEVLLRLLEVEWMKDEVVVGGPRRNAFWGRECGDGCRQEMQEMQRRKNEGRKLKKRERIGERRIMNIIPVDVRHREYGWRNIVSRTVLNGREYPVRNCRILRYAREAERRRSLRNCHPFRSSSRRSRVSRSVRMLLSFLHLPKLVRSHDYFIPRVMYE